MRIFFSVGEPSGDLHGSNLIHELRDRESDMECVGFGGPKMQAAGCNLLADLTELAIMGFARVVPHLWRFWQLRKLAARYFREQRPDAVVLIDYPGFNWWIAAAAQQSGIPVFYYGTPQIWAWATHRVHKLRRLVDHSLCKLPFEPAWYRQHNCEAVYVGHPYFDDFLNRQLDTSFLSQLDAQPLVALLPGSRRHEVQNNLPAFIRTADKVREKLPQVQFAIAAYNDQLAQLSEQILARHKNLYQPAIFVDRTRELIHRAECCLACSGSVSLELLHEQKPTVIHYKIDRLGDFLQKRFRKCKFITLVNLLQSDRRFESNDNYDPNDIRNLEEAPFPEYLTVDDRSADMANHLQRWLSDEQARLHDVKRLSTLQSDFVQPGASRKAAEYVLQQLSHATAPPKEPQTDIAIQSKVA